MMTSKKKMPWMNHYYVEVIVFKHSKQLLIMTGKSSGRRQQKGTNLRSSTVSEYMVYGDLASRGSRSIALPHSVKDRAASA